MARKKKRRSKKFTIPIAPIAGLAIALADPVDEAIKGNTTRALKIIGARFTGIDARQDPYTFNIEELKRGLLPIVVGGLVHKFVGGAPLNVNRMLAAAGVPVVRI